MAVAFVRQLGAEPGIQLNPLRDGSLIPTQDNYDQCAGIMMRATRGRIDKPFKVHRGNVYKLLGRGEPVRTNALNEAWRHVVEGVNKGVYEMIVQRLVTSAAAIKYAVLDQYAVSPTLPWTANAALPAGFDIAVKHLGCHNDGIKIELHTDEVTSGGVMRPTKNLTLRIRDAENFILYEFTGSLDPAAKDAYGNSTYLPDVASMYSDGVEIEVGATFTEILPTSPMYGYDADGRQKWYVSPLLMCFDEGGFAYTVADYSAAREKLQKTPFNYAYISSGGSQSPAMMAQLAQLAFDTNRMLRFDIPGNLNPEGAVAFQEQLNMGASPTPGLMHAYYSVLHADDPTGINGKGYMGEATLNIAMACLRNAQRNAKGFAPKNFPVAGKDFPIQRTGMKQVRDLSQQELSMLAGKGINVNMYSTFSGGGRYVFTDSLTCAQEESSLIRLIAVAEMSTSIDDAITRFEKDILQKPMKYAIRYVKDALTRLFEGAEASEWIVPSKDPLMEGKSFRFEVFPNEQRPYDRLDVNYWVRYDGTVRQIFNTQTLNF